jgi:hypothetical protein
MIPAFQNNQYEVEAHLQQMGPVLIRAAQARELRSDLLLPPNRTAMPPPRRTITWNDTTLDSTLHMQTIGSGSFGSVWKVRLSHFLNVLTGTVQIGAKL